MQRDFGSGLIRVHQAESGDIFCSILGASVSRSRIVALETSTFSECAVCLHVFGFGRLGGQGSRRQIVSVFELPACVQSLGGARSCLFLRPGS